MDLRQLECMACHRIWYINYKQDDERPCFCPWCGIQFGKWVAEEEARA